MNLGNLNRRNQILLMVIVPILSFVLFYIFYLADTRNKIQNLTKENESIKSEIEKANKMLAKAEELKNQIKELEKERERLLILVPQESDLFSFSKKFENLASKEGLNLEIWKPFGKFLHRSGDLYEFPVYVELRGNYHSFLSFLSKLETLERLLSLKFFVLLRGNIDYQGKLIKGIEPSNLRIKMSFSAYSMVDEKEKRKLEDKGKK